MIIIIVIEIIIMIIMIIVYNSFQSTIKIPNNKSEKKNPTSSRFALIED